MDEVVEDSARSGFFLVSGNLLSTGIMAIATILIGRFLGPELYGEYTLCLVVPTLLLLFADLGIYSGITRFAASLRSRGETSQIAKIVSHGLLFQILAGLVISAVNILFANQFAVLINRPSLGSYIQIMSISIIFQIVLNSSEGAFTGLDKTEYNALLLNTQAVVKTVSSIALILLGFGVAGAIIGYVAGYVVAGILAAGILLFKILMPQSKGIRNGIAHDLKMLFSYGTPLYLSVLLLGLLSSYQQFILAFFTSNYDIGNLRASGNFLTLASTIPTSITTALLPAFSKLDSSRAEKIRIFFKRANKYVCLLIVPIATLLIILSAWIVEIIYGPSFQLASLLLSIGCLSYFLAGIGYLTLPSLFNGLGETRTTLKITIINFLTLIPLSLILARTYGVIGVLLASLFSSAISMVYAVYIARTKFEIEFEVGSIGKIYLISATSAIPSLLLVHFMRLSDFVAVAVGGVLYLLVYITLVPMTSIIGPYELQRVRQVTEKIRILGKIAKPVLEYQEIVRRRKDKVRRQFINRRDGYE